MLEEVYISSKRSFMPNFLEIWKYKLLLLALIKRNIKLRYKQTILGVMWVIIQPIALSGVFAIIFGKLMAVQTDNTPYVAFVLSGVLLWQLFSRSLSEASTSLIGFSSVITKVYFPRILIPLASVFTALFDFIIVFPLVLLVLFLVNGAIPFHSFWIVPAAILMTILISMGLGFLFSSINVIFRDVQHTIPFLLQLGLYLSPIVYSSATVPEKWRWLYILNPFVGIIELFRYGLLPQASIPHLDSIMISLMMSLLWIVIGGIIFCIIEQVMIDRI